MLPLIPYKHITLYSDLSLDEAKALVAGAISSRQSWPKWHAEGDHEFEGDITGNKFKINRVIRYRNSFLPIVYGRFSPTKTGVQIDIHMTLHPHVILFASSFCLFFAPMALNTLASWLTVGFASAPALPVLLMIGFYLMVILGFNWELWQAEEFVRRLWPAGRN